MKSELFNPEDIPHRVAVMVQMGLKPAWIEGCVRHCYPGLGEEYYLAIREILGST